MLFTSIQFVVFFLVVLALNQPLRRWPLLQKLMLLVASYYFYAQWNWHYLFLVWFSTVVDYTIGLRLPRSPSPRRLIIISVIVNLGFLAIFKYANWLIDTFNGGAAVLGSNVHITPLDVILPVGISFYTFQSLSYTIDVYRGVMQPRRNFLDYALAVAFFPQLEAGPIVRAREFFAELDGPKRVQLADVQRALVLIAFGFAKKMVFADSLAVIADSVFDHPAGAGFWNTLLAIYAFALQIYCDFSGYTDIAIGCALLLGIRFPQNFNYPYIAQSIQDFWRRWHMTLSRWLRDYLYISLGGNRGSAARTLVNLMITMLLGGLWHGASWNFVIWGGLHGMYLVIERVGLSRWQLWQSPSRAMALVRWFVTFHLVCFAWIFFRSRSLTGAVQMIGNLLHGATAALRDFSQEHHLGIMLLIALMLATHFFNGYRNTKERLGVDRGPRFAAAMTLVLLLLILFTPNHSAPFIYFQF
jgi:D-alanyl-lipoteichoic acid acyltransferase DltB (MBOAT superfamily)